MGKVNSEQKFVVNTNTGAMVRKSTGFNHVAATNMSKTNSDMQSIAEELPLTTKKTRPSTSNFIAKI